MFRCLVFGLVIGRCCFAQTWSIGAAGGFGYSSEAAVENTAGSAKARFGTGFAAGAVLGENVSEHFGGELRYTYRNGHAELRSGGREATLDAAAHVLHYDFLAYATRRRARLRPFAAAGGGMRRYTGTGQMDPLQPLRNIALLAHNDQLKGLVSFGGGVKAAIGDNWSVRADFRDYATPFPEKLIVPVAGAKVHGWLHDLVPMFGIDWTFGR